MPRVGGFASLVKTLWSRGNRPISVGITARLSLSFAAVAVLAAAANLIIEHGVAIIRTSHVDRGLISPRPATLPRAPVPGAQPI